MVKAASPGYFEAMKIPLLSGRDFASLDQLDGEGSSWSTVHLRSGSGPGPVPLDQRVVLPFLSEEPRRVVGVVGIFATSVTIPLRNPQIYVPNLQFASVSQTYVVKTKLSGTRRRCLPASRVVRRSRLTGLRRTGDDENR